MQPACHSTEIEEGDALKVAAQKAFDYCMQSQHVYTIPTYVHEAYGTPTDISTIEAHLQRLERHKRVSYSVLKHAVVREVRARIYDDSRGC